MSIHKWKVGDEAFSIRDGWVVLTESTDKCYPLQGGKLTLTLEGRVHRHDSFPSLLDHNPFDPNDPKNPPEFRYPFMLNGRPVKIGDRLKFKVAEDISVVALSIEEEKPFVYRKGTRVPLNSAYLCWPDELPVKKKVAKWVYVGVGIEGNLVGFSQEEMTKEEAVKRYGSNVRMIPGTEREVEE